MTQFKHYLLCTILLLAGFATSMVSRAETKYVMVGEKIASNQVTDGDLLVFEAASTTANYGYYVKESEGAYAWTEGFDNSAVWRAVATGKKSTRYTAFDTYYLQNAVSGNYMKSAKTSATTTATTDEATEYVFFDKSNAPYNYADYSNQTTFPRGWDDSSWVVYDIVDYWWRNDGAQHSTGTFNGNGTHNYMWNVRKAEAVTPSVPKAKLMDIVFNADGTATDVSPMANTVQAFGTTTTEYNDTYGKYVATFRDAYNGVSDHFYKIDYSTNQEFIDALKDGHTLETTFCPRVAPTLSKEGKWFGSTSQGGTAFVGATTGYGNKIGGEIAFIPNVNTTTTSKWNWAASGVQMEKDIFYHVVGVWDKDAGTAKIYINGELKGTADAIGNLRLPKGGTDPNYLWWCIGGSVNGAEAANSGGSWDVVTARIYDNPLTAEQVSLLWEQERPKAALPKANLLDVTFGEGNTATDVSGNNYTVSAQGTVSNFYDANLQQYVADIDNGTAYAAKIENYYAVAFAPNDTIANSLPNGYSFESIVSTPQVKTTSSEAKWFGNTSSGGTALMLKNGKFAITNNVGGGYKWATNDNSAAGVLQPEINRYYHIVGLWDKEAGESRIYVNGKLLGKGTNSIGDLKLLGRYTFGLGANGDAGGGASWKIATQRVYSAALRDVEVGELYATVSDKIATANAFEKLKETIAKEKLTDYDNDPTIIASSLANYKAALQAAEQVVTEITALTSGEGKTIEEYETLLENIAKGKNDIETIPTAPVADILDAQFNEDGSATDLSTMGNTIERKGNDNVVEYSKVFGKNIAKFTGDYASAPENYYKIDYTGTTHPILTALQSGHTFESVFCLREGNITNVESKWLSTTQSGGTAMMICTQSRGKNGQNEITFLPNTTGPTSGWKFTSSGVKLEVGTYYHVIGVWDKTAGKARVYINGELLNEIDASGNWTAPSAAAHWICIGGDPTGAGTAEQGAAWNIAVARIYNDPLTKGQIDYLWEQEKTGVLLAPSYEHLEALVKNYSGDENDYQAAAASNEKIATFLAVLAEAKAMLNAEELKTAEEYTAMANRLSAAYDQIAVGSDYKYFNDLAVKEGSYVLIKATGLTATDKIKLIPSQGDKNYTLDLTAVDNGVKFFIPADFISGKYDMSIIRDNITYAPFGNIQLDMVENLPIGSRVTAHRGYFNAVPSTSQNSRQAMRNAFAEGFAAAETDVWLTTDEHIVVNHDASVGGKTIQTSKWADLANVKLGNGELVPQLEDFLDILKYDFPDSPTKLQIEVKYNTSSTNTLRLCELMVNLVKEYGMEDRVNYISYSMPACQKILELNPKADVAFLAGSGAHKTPADLITFGDMGLDYDHTVIKAHPEYVDQASQMGMISIIYTVDLESQLLTYNKMGVDFIATNHPDIAQEIFEYYQDNNKLTAEVNEGTVTTSFTGKITPDMYTAAMGAIDEEFTSVDLSNANPTRDLTYKILTSAATNPNTIFYLPANTRLGGDDNVVVNNTCQNLVLADKKDFAPAAPFTATKATYQRNIDNAWYSAVLPYDVKVPEGLIVLNNAEVSEASIAFSEVEAGETIPANTPFIYRKEVPGEESVAMFTAANVEVTAEPKESGALLGTYTNITEGEAEGKLILNANGSAFTVATELATIPAFSAYLNGVEGTSSNIFMICIGEDPTGVAEITDGIINTTPVDVYTTDGKLVRAKVDPVTALQGLQSGTYIVNGKKIKK